MAEKLKACKECGHLTIEKECPICKNKNFADKYKGNAVILNAKDSIIAQKLDIKNNGKYALKYN